MENKPAAPAVVKEFQFYPESHKVIVVFGDDRTVEFTGEQNYKPAHHAAVKASNFAVATPVLEMTNDAGETVTLNVPEGTPHETFDF